MKRKRSVLLAAALSAVFFFCVGLGWGFWSRKKQSDQFAQGTPLRMLCGENWISDSVLKRFSVQHNIRIQQWTYSHPSEFLRQMANADGNIDVICVSSMLIRSLVHSHWI